VWLRSRLAALRLGAQQSKWSFLYSLKAADVCMARPDFLGACGRRKMCLPAAGT